MNIKSVETKYYGRKNILSYCYPYGNSNYIQAEIQVNSKCGNQNFRDRIRGVISPEGEEIVSFNSNIGRVIGFDTNTFAVARAKYDEECLNPIPDYDYEIYKLNGKQLELLIITSSDYRQISDNVLQIHVPSHGTCLYSLSEKKIISDYYTNIFPFEYVNGKYIAKVSYSAKIYSDLRDEQFSDGVMNGSVEAYLVAYIDKNGKYVTPIYDTLNKKFINPNMEPIDFEASKQELVEQVRKLADKESNVYTKYLKPKK